MIGIESEIAIRFARDLPPRQSAHSDDEVASLETIEICDSHLAGRKGAPPIWKLANLQSNSALETGTGTRGWRDVDFSA